jgi:ubiquinone biosynthesis monooxygenase Coq7
MNRIDQLITTFDLGLRTVFASQHAGRPYPASEAEAPLSDAERAQAAALMRVNHVGEVCAQALYSGQALTAKNETVRVELEQAAREETDHLAWCEARLHELDSRPSLLNPAFYALSYALGAATALLGDRVSLGFVEATEDQVCRHIDEHLQALPPEDARSREILEHMRADEARHGETALARGGVGYYRGPDFVQVDTGRVRRW